MTILVYAAFPTQNTTTVGVSCVLATVLVIHSSLLVPPDCDPQRPAFSLRPPPGAWLRMKVAQSEDSRSCGHCDQFMLV